MRRQTNSVLCHHPPFVGALSSRESRAEDASSDIGTFGCVLTTVIYHSLSMSRSPRVLPAPALTSVFYTSASPADAIAENDGT
jgi:hypothetical protein